jgi:pentatricopeptide repeat protein
MSHKDFLSAAADCATAGRRVWAVKVAMRFTQLVPRAYTLPATYNMLITVCVRAQDLPHALQAADMMRSTGRRLDTILYTNLLHGAGPPCSLLALSPFLRGPFVLIAMAFLPCWTPCAG